MSILLRNTFYKYFASNHCFKLSYPLNYYYYFETYSTETFRGSTAEVVFIQVSIFFYKKKKINPSLHSILQQKILWTFLKGSDNIFVPLLCYFIIFWNSFFHCIRNEGILFPIQREIYFLNSYIPDILLILSSCFVENKVNSIKNILL